MDEFENRLLIAEVFIFNKLNQNEQCRPQSNVLNLTLSTMILRVQILEGNCSYISLMEKDYFQD